MKKIHIANSFLIIGISILTTSVIAMNNSNNYISKKTPKNISKTSTHNRSMSDSPVFTTDALGRKLPLPEEVGPLRTDKFVGIFYFTFTHYDAPVYDISKILAKYPNAESNPNSPPWGPFGANHYWGEPLFGYYKIMDTWVLRRHAQLLSDAGIDFVVFDTTNGKHYPNIMPIILDTWTELRAAGNPTPQCIFMVNTKAGDTAQRIYDSFYSNEKWSNLWFHWKGKPLMICDPADASNILKKTFTLRKAHWPFELVNTHNEWHWEAAYPQVYSYDKDPAKAEEVNVSVAQNLSTDIDAHVTLMNRGDARGRHFHDGALDSNPLQAALRGANFQEQWNRAFELDPDVVFITGWNEWVAGRIKSQVCETLPVGGFCDQYNLYDSRDAEMSRGPLGDNFYCQLTANIRKFKGMAPLPPASKPKTINLNKSIKQWNDVEPEYRDFTLETLPRDYPGEGGIHYTNTTGRNDISIMKIARDNDMVYFLAKTRNQLSPHSDPNWMLLLIDTDLNPKTGWEGFDFLVKVTPDGSAKLLKWNGKTWINEKTPVTCSIGDSSVQYAIHKKVLGLGNKLTFEFKWVDNIALPCDILDFYVNGDVAPAGRFRYRYISY